jgi:hypothetical protein
MIDCLPKCNIHMHFYSTLNILNKLVDQTTHKQAKILILKGIF